MTVGESVDIDNPENLLATMLDAASFMWHAPAYDIFSVAVTAVDVYGVESKPVTVQLRNRLPLRNER